MSTIEENTMHPIQHSFIYLASQSPRRQELLHQIGVDFQLLLADSDEDSESLETQKPHEVALEYVKRVTLAKLEAAKHRLQKRQLPWAPILCADTTVAITLKGEEFILGKPTDMSDAKRILGLLSGQTHHVHTAIALLPEFSAHDFSPILKVSSSSVTFKELSLDEIDTYVASLEPMGKAGAYGIQGQAGALISHISGSFSGIMGLPLFETSEVLKETGVKFSNRT